MLPGVPTSVPTAAADKRRWDRKWLGDIEVRCVKSKDKALFCKPGDLLIDDWKKYRHLWLKAGGRWITHTSAAETIRQLKEIK